MAGLIEPMLSSAGAYSLALCTHPNESSDDRPPDALKIPARQGGIYTLPENVASPFQAEPAQAHVPTLLLAVRPHYSRFSVLHTSESTEFALGSSTGMMIWCGKRVRGAMSGFADRVQVGDLRIRSLASCRSSSLWELLNFVFSSSRVMTWQVLVPASMDRTSEQMLRDVLPFSQDWT